MPTYEYRCKECDKRFEITCHLEERKNLAAAPSARARRSSPSSAPSPARRRPSTDGRTARGPASYRLGMTFLRT